MRRALVLLLLLLAACEPEATPLPVSLPTSTSSPAPPPPIRYGLVNPDLLAAIIPANNPPQIETITDPSATDLLGAQFDIIIAPGSWQEATPTPIEIQVGLVINSELYPLDDPALRLIISDLVRHDSITADLDIPGIRVTPIATSDLRTLRTRLANAGWPDGFDLIVVLADLPGRTPLVDRFTSAGLQIQQARDFAWDSTHLALIRWIGDSPPADWTRADIVTLYSLPVSYQAIPELDITFSPTGWPLARWQAAP